MNLVGNGPLLGCSTKRGWAVAAYLNGSAGSTFHTRPRFPFSGIAGKTLPGNVSRKKLPESHPGRPWKHTKPWPTTGCQGAGWHCVWFKAMAHVRRRQNNSGLTPVFIWQVFFTEASSENSCYLFICHPLSWQLASTAVIHSLHFLSFQCKSSKTKGCLVSLDKLTVCCHRGKPYFSLLSCWNIKRGTMCHSLIALFRHKARITWLW